MKFYCEKTLLVEAVSNVSRAVSSKSTLPALEGILLQAKGNTLLLTGYDLEMGITTAVPAEVAEEGNIVLSARLFGDIIRKMSGETVSFESDSRLLSEVKCGMTQYTILGTPSEDYPELPVPKEEETFTISQGTLKSMIEQTLFAVSTSDAKPVHTGSLFDLEENQLTVVSVDGFRMAVRKEAIQNSVERKFVVPGKTLSEIAKLLKDDDMPCTVRISQKHVVTEIEGYQVVSRLLEGDFLDYHSALPKSSSTEVTVETRVLMDSIERLSLLISDRIKSPLRVTYGDERIELRCSTSLGKAYDEVQCKKTGPDVEMGFNNKYILDALRASGKEKVKLQISGPLSPMTVVPLEGDSFLFLVLPVRLKAE